MSVDFDELLSDAMTRSTDDVFLAPAALGRAVRKVDRRRQMTVAAAAVLMVGAGTTGIVAAVSGHGNGRGEVVQTARAANNLRVTDAVRQQLITTWALAQGLARKYVAGTAPGSVYYGHLTSTNTDWAVSSFTPIAAVKSSTGNLGAAFQDGPWVFSKPAGGSWKLVTDSGGVLCPREVPPALAKVWSLPTPQGCGRVTHSTSPAYSRYSNARFGFSVEVPTAYKAGRLPADRDGREFTNAAGTANVTAYGGDNVLNRTPAGELSAQRSRYASEGDTVTYKHRRGNVIAVSGTTTTGTVFYLREVVLSKAIYSLEWSYPVASRASFNTVVNHSAATFQPGPNKTA
jgi:hypothetical protein